MSQAWTPPRPTYHLRIFAVCLVLVIVSLAGLLFGVRLEAVVPATGVIIARDQQEVRTQLAGLIEVGWHEGEIVEKGTSLVRTRLDSQGNGMTDPSAGASQLVFHYQLEDGRRLVEADIRFHRLQVGDELWPGQVLATINTDELRFRLRALENREEDSPQARLRHQEERTWMLHQLDQALIRVPSLGDLWLTLEVRAAHLQAAQAGDAVATIVPIHPETRQPRDLIARLAVDEGNFADIRPQESVRLYSNMFNHRLHGCAEAEINRIEPVGEPAANGKRVFHALAPLTQSPLPLPLGSTFKADILVGRKQVYRIILEH